MHRAIRGVRKEPQPLPKQQREGETGEEEPASASVGEAGVEVKTAAAAAELAAAGAAGAVAAARAVNEVGEAGEGEGGGDVWSAHSTHRASLPTGKSGVKDVLVVLFRIERGAGPPPPAPP